ncbi:hypothetical protein [Paracoccus sp. Ld10]|uniref:hypothetical protein n=1 Tax=Paracoccus sp. Ld10 TaxID=649158 RepID=UPI003869ACEA
MELTTAWTAPLHTPTGLAPALVEWCRRQGITPPAAAPDVPSLMAQAFGRMTPGWFLPSAVLSPGAANTTTAPAGAGPLMTPDALPDPARGCIIAVIDDAVPFAHQHLRLPGGLSRVASLWVQDVPVDPGGPGRDLPWGRELRGDMISGWLAGLESGAIAAEDTVYRHAGVVAMDRRTTHSAAFAAGHGAAVTLLAAGFAPNDPRARDHPVIAVNLAPGVIADTSATLAQDPLLAAIVFAMTRARMLCRQVEAARSLPRNSVRLPVVLNLSLGLTAGPRDGTGLVERFLDALATHTSAKLGPVHVVLPTGNHRMARLRATLRPQGVIGWQVPPDDATQTPLEIWGPVRADHPDEPMRIGLTPPSRTQARTAFGAGDQSSVLRDARGHDLARAFYRVMPHPDGWRECVTLIVAPTCPAHAGDGWAPPGRWQLQLVQGDGDHAVSVQRDDVLRGFSREARQSRLYHPAYAARDARGFPLVLDPPDNGTARLQRADTVNAYATGRHGLRVGAVDRRGRGMAYASLIGTAGGGDLLACVDRSPGLDGMIVRGRISGSFCLLSGTSVAAPQATRWLAAQLADGARPRDRAAIQRLAGGTTDGPVPVLPTRFQHE